MAAPLDYHVFSHVEGRYQSSEASEGISQSETASLEQFVFGQTNDQAYLSTLATRPGVIWRRVGDRFALTRVLRGANDAHDRATLCFETLLMGTAEVQQVARMVARVVISPWPRGDGRVTLRQLKSLSGEPLHPEIVSEAVLAVEDGKRFVHSDQAASLRDVEAIVQRCFEKDDFSLTFRALNPQITASVAFLHGAARKRILNKQRTEPVMQPLPSAPHRPAFQARGNLSLTALVALVLALQLILLTVVLWRSPGSQAPGQTVQEAIIGRLLASQEEAAGDREKQHGKLARSNLETRAEHETRLAGIDKRLAALEKEVDLSAQSVKSIVGGVVPSIDAVRTKLDGILFETRSLMAANTQSLSEKMESHLRNDFLRESLAAIDAACGAMGEDIASLNNMVGGLKTERDQDSRDTRATKIETRLDEMRDRLDAIRRIAQVDRGDGAATPDGGE